MLIGQQIQVLNVLPTESNPTPLEKLTFQNIHPCLLSQNHVVLPFFTFMLTGNLNLSTDKIVPSRSLFLTSTVLSVLEVTYSTYMTD